MTPTDPGIYIVNEFNCVWWDAENNRYRGVPQGITLVMVRDPNDANFGNLCADTAVGYRPVSSFDERSEWFGPIEPPSIVRPKPE